MAANRNLNQEQFGEDNHNEVISGIEDMHGVGFTKMGLQYGDDGRIAPIAGVTAHSADEVEAKSPHNSINFRLPTEDPNVSNTMWLTNRSALSGSVYGVPTGVTTDEYHAYPDSGEMVYRYNHHEDVPSAMEHLAQGIRERAEHLEAGTVPEEGPVQGTWNAGRMDTEFETKALEPPSIIKYSHDENRYDVDTGTRERIPKED